MTYKKESHPGLLSVTEKEFFKSKSYLKAFGLFFIAFTAYVGCLSLALYIGNIWAVPFSILTGVLISSLFVIGHDASHGAFVKHKVANQIIGRITFIPILKNYSLWDLYHNKYHHAFTNLKGYDSGWVPLSLQEYNEFSPLKKKFYKFYRSYWGSGIYYMVDVWARLIVIPYQPKNFEPKFRPKKVYWIDFALVLASIPLQVFLFIQLGKLVNPGLDVWKVLLLGMIIPFISWNYTVGIVTLLQHTGKEVKWYNDKKEWNFFQANLGSTTYLHYPIINPLFLDVTEHTTHHLHPKIPVYNLRLAQKKIAKRSNLEIMKVKNGYVALMDTIKNCKLYDYNNHQWTDFNGNPTGPILKKPESELALQQAA